MCVRTPVAPVCNPVCEPVCDPVCDPVCVLCAHLCATLCAHLCDLVCGPCALTLKAVWSYYDTFWKFLSLSSSSGWLHGSKKLKRGRWQEVGTGEVQ